jgi:hypothetical protein
MPHIHFSWKTSKTANGFQFTVSLNQSLSAPNAEGRYVNTKVIKTGTLPTRARAKTMAQKWVRFFKWEWKIRLEAAEEDLQILEQSGASGITGTNRGTVMTSFDDGVYLFRAQNNFFLQSSDRQKALMALAEVYIVMRD